MATTIVTEVDVTAPVIGPLPNAVRFKELSTEQTGGLHPELSVRAGQRPYIDPHSGVLICACGHDLGEVHWPLAAGIHHLNNRCRWSCCNSSWELKLCSHECGNVINEKGKYKPWEKTREYNTALDATSAHLQDAELVGTLRQSSASLIRANELLALKEKEKDSAATEGSDEGDNDVHDDSMGEEGESFNMSRMIEDGMLATGEVVVESSIGLTDGAIYGASIVASLFHSSIVQPFLPELKALPADLEEVLKALARTRPDDAEGQFSELLDKAVHMYLEILELSDAQYLTMESWIVAALQSWRKFHQKSTPPLSTPVSDDTASSSATIRALLETASIFADDIVVKDLEACCGGAVGTKALKVTTYVDWYVVYHFRSVKFTIPEMTGFPLLTELHLSAAAIALKKNPALYAQLKEAMTQSNFSFDRAIQPGIDYPSLPFGCCAGDEESYVLFKDFYKAALLESSVFAPRGDQGEVEWGDGHRGSKDWDFTSVANMQEIDILYVRQCAVKARRNLSGVSFPVHCSRAGRRKAERIIHAALSSIEGEFVGVYTPLFKETSAAYAHPEAFCSQIGAGRDWPFGRGIFRSDDQSLCVFVNGEDHLRLEIVGKSQMGRTLGCDVVSMFQKFARASAAIEQSLMEGSETKLAESSDFGFLTSCPSKSGTALEMEYSLKLDNLNSPVYNLRALCARLGLACWPQQDGLSSTVWTVAVLHHVGCSEVEMMQTLVDGVKTLITLEKSLEKRDSERFARLVDTLPKRFSLGKILRRSGGGASGRRKGGGDDNDLTSATDDSVNSSSSLNERVSINPDDDYPLFSPQHESLMAKHMTRELYSSLRSPEATKAAMGWSVSQLIRVGIEVPSHPTGVMMGGAESYEVYKHLIAPILNDYHGFSAVGYDRSSHLTDLDLAQGLADADAVAAVFMRKVSLSASRNISAFPFPASMTRKQRRMVEFLLYNAFKSLDGDLVGRYVPLQSMTKAQIKILAKRRVAFASPSHGGPLVAGGCTRDFPDARGVFMSKSGRVIGIVNGENHLRLVVEGGGHELESTVLLLTKALDRLEAALQPNGFCFAHSDRLGFLTTRLEDVGTAMHLYFSLSLPALSRDAEQLAVLARREHMTVTREDDDDESWVFANMKTLCVTEADTLKCMLNSLLNVSRLERSLRKERFSPQIKSTLEMRVKQRASIGLLVGEMASRSELIAEEEQAAKQRLSTFIVNHRRNSSSRASFGGVLASLEAKALEEERQKANARKIIAASLSRQQQRTSFHGVMGDLTRSRSPTPHSVDNTPLSSRKSFHSVMTELVITVPLTPAEKGFLQGGDDQQEEEEVPSPMQFGQQGSGFSLEQVAASAVSSLSSFFSPINDVTPPPSSPGRPSSPSSNRPPSPPKPNSPDSPLSISHSASPSPTNARASTRSPTDWRDAQGMLTPPKPPKPQTPNKDVLLEQQYLEAAKAQDGGRRGVFSTSRDAEVPSHIEQLWPSLTKGVVASVSSSGKTGEPSYIFVDPLTKTLHWAAVLDAKTGVAKTQEQRRKDAHGCVVLEDCKAIDYDCKASLFGPKGQMLLSLSVPQKQSGGMTAILTVSVIFKGDNDLPRAAKLAWIKELVLLLGKGQVSLSPAAVAYIQAAPK